MTLPTIAVLPPAIKRIRNYDCWVFRDELARPADSLSPGTIVEVVDRAGAFVAYASYNHHAHIPLRIFSTVQEQPVDRRLLRNRLQQAIAKRQRLNQTNAKRLVFSEADGLPGLIVDQYADWLVIQIRTAGMEVLRPLLLAELTALVPANGILERSDKEFRDDEGLPPSTRLLQGTVPDRIRITEGALQFWVDPHRGLKTGFYLDQRRTRGRLLGWVQHGQRVLDAFSYTGSLGIAAAAAGAQVVCVEQTEAFVEMAKENARLNHVEDRIEHVAGDAFYWLQADPRAAGSYDWVLLDPPALAKTKSQVTKARQALHHLVVHSLSLLRPQGHLMLSICTYHLLELVEEIVRIAASDRGIRLSVLDQWGQAEDHPWILQLPASRYLTSWRVARDAPSAA